MEQGGARANEACGCRRRCRPAVMAGQVRAHHAFSSEFDVKKPLKLKGTSSKWEMINPHSWFHIDVKDPDGQVVEWMIEGGSPNSLIRLGMTKNTMPIGTEFTIEAYRRRTPRTRPSDGTSSWPTASGCSSGRRVRLMPHPRRRHPRRLTPRRSSAFQESASRRPPARAPSIRSSFSPALSVRIEPPKVTAVRRTIRTTCARSSAG